MGLGVQRGALAGNSPFFSGSWVVHRHANENHGDSFVFNKLDMCLMFSWNLGRRKPCWLYDSWWQKEGFTFLPPGPPLRCCQGDCIWVIALGVHPITCIFGSLLLVTSPGVVFCPLFSTNVTQPFWIASSLRTCLCTEQDILITFLISHCLCSSPLCGMRPNQSKREAPSGSNHLMRASVDRVFYCSSPCIPRTPWNEKEWYTVDPWKAEG